jgi:hypothetical protein
VNGTKVASLTQGKAVYLKTLAAGLYKVTAATNTSGVSNQTYYEKINKATPTESITSTPSNFTYNGTKMTITGSISTLNNQLSSTFSINSNTIGTTTTSISYSNATANTYTATISTSGNQNYTSATLTKTFEIAKATPTLTATVNGKALGSYTIRASNLSLNGTVSPSLLTANFYDNGKLLGTSPQNITYGFSTLGNNVIVFNTSGNENYTSATITGTINLTTNQFTIQDVEQSGTSFSTFNLTISNSTKSKSFTNLAYGSKILYSDLPQGDLTFNFTANLADYNWTTETAANSIFTTTNQTVQGKQWEWIYFNAYVKQTGTALSAYNYTLTTSTSYKLAANLTNNPIKVSLQYLYPKSNLTIRKFGYNVTSNIYSFTLSPSANTIAVSVSEAGIVIYGINALTSTSLKNMTLLFANGTAQKTYSNVTLPFSLYSGFLTGNVVITASKSPEDNISYTTADYYVTLTDQSTLNLTTYLFDDTYATTATFQTQYSYGGLASGAVVYLQSSVSPFKILEECKTLGSGQCQMALVTAASYQYYAAVPDTNEISVVSPLSVVSTTSGSGGACPTGIWCSYLSTPPPTLITLPTMNITSSPSTSFVAANQPLDFTATVSTTQNDLGGLELNTSVYVNDTYVNSTFVSVNTNPTKQTISKTTIAPNDSYNAEIIENVTILTSNGQEHFTYTYYVEGTASTVGNPTITAIFKNFGKGLGQYGPIIFLIILTGAAIMMWVLTESILFTQLVLDALSGFFAYAGVFSGALAPYGDALGWGLFGIFLVFTIMYQLSNVGGMG